MFPNGFLGMSPFLLNLPLVVGVGFLAIAVMARRDRASLGRVFALQAILGGAALAGAKIFSVAERGWTLSQPLASELSGGWRYPGGLAAIAIALVVLRRVLLPTVGFARYADWLAPSMAFGHAATRVACFFNGCCVGGICQAPWCIPFPRGSYAWASHLANPAISPPGAWTEPVLPLQLVFLAVAAAVGAFLLWFDRRRRYDGQTALVFLAVHEGAKFGLELLRRPEVPSLQLAALVPASVGALALMFLAVRHRVRRGNPQPTSS